MERTRNIASLLLILSLSSAYTVTYNNQTALVWQGSNNIANATVLNKMHNNGTAWFLDDCDLLSCNMKIKIISKITFTITNESDFKGKTTKGEALPGNTTIETPRNATRPRYYEQCTPYSQYNATNLSWQNWTECTQVQNGTERYNYTTWEPIGGKTLTANKDNTISVPFTKPPFGKTDIIPTIMGENLTGFAWWDASWGWAYPISYNSTVQPTSNLTNFPFWVRIDTTNAAYFSGNCTNARFTNAANDTLMPYVVVGRCNTNQTIFRVAVNATSPSSDTNTNGYMYVGNTGAADGSNGSYTFMDYRTVLLMNETNNNATANDALKNYPFKDYGVIINNTGRLGEPTYNYSNTTPTARITNQTPAAHIGFNNDYDKTVSAWVFPNTTTPGYRAPIITIQAWTKTTTTTKVCYRLFFDATGLRASRVRPGTAEDLTAAVAVPANNWLHVAIAYTNSTGNLTLYLNGAEVASKTSTGEGSAGCNLDQPIGSGGMDDSTTANNMLINSVMISPTRRSASWIMAEYAASATVGSIITAPSASTCTYSGSGDWLAKYEDQCNITTKINMSNNFLRLYGGNGTFAIKSGGSISCKGMNLTPETKYYRAILAIELGGTLNLTK